MLLENRYFEITDARTILRKEAVFRVRLLPDCDVYRGHFPGRPVCPGVCNIEMIKECAMLLSGRELSIGTIRQCRFTAVASPSISPELDVAVSLLPAGDDYVVSARISDKERTYVEYKGNMTAV